ncbi:transcriptional regulator [Sporotomaculum syntrophicum]|uniref:transcriptional regulator n=1 Tax=Sporotomaculum syntrophicum TaxID=182264 RepID=UPI00137A2427|nr:transcriptional regulator [Sporotomaculum syntrophicum]
MEITKDANIFNCILFYLIIYGIFTFLILPRVVKAVNRTDNLPQIREAVKKTDNEITVLKLDDKDKIDMVIDNVCGCILPWSKAYVLIINNTRHYFCSWDCREKFINSNSTLYKTPFKS